MVMHSNGILPPVSSVIQVRRLQFAGHCYRSKNKVVNVNRVILWEPRHERRSRGKMSEELHEITLAADTGAGSSELPELMENREQWKTIVNSQPKHARQSREKCSSLKST